MNLIPKRKLTGKISALPLDVREWINHALDNGLSYPKIISELAAKGHHGFNKNNLARWRRSGYEQWLKAIDRKDAVRIRSETAIKAVKSLKPGEKHKLNDMNKMLVAQQLGETLDDFHGLGDTLNKRPENFFRVARLVNQDAEQHWKQKRLEIALLKLQHQLDI